VADCALNGHPRLVLQITPVKTVDDTPPVIDAKATYWSRIAFLPTTPAFNVSVRRVLWNIAVMFGIARR